MSEIEKETVESTEAAVAEEEANGAKKEKKPSPFAGMKEQKGLKAKIKFFFDVLEKYPTVKQAILFTLFSMICGITQMIITLVLPIILRAASPEKMTESFKWFIFDYTEAGLGEFIGFLVGSVWGQTLTFILNRKKTFNVPDHVAFRAIAYAIMAILIILMQTAIGGGIQDALKNAVPDASKTVLGIFNLIAQVVAGLAAFIVSFLGNKFVVMRKWKTKNAPVAEEKAESEKE